MQYAQRQTTTTIPGTRKLLVPVLALALGVAGATGAYALIDNDGSSVAPADTRVIVADPPAQPGEGVSAKNEAGVAATIGNPALPGQGVSAKNEAGVAATIGKPAQPGEGTLSKNEAGVAALMGNPGAGSSTETKDEAAIAAAIGHPGTGTYASPKTKDEAATAAVIAPSKGSVSQTPDQANRTDPHGPASALP